MAEVARRLADADIIVNVQGDEPELSGASIDLAIELLENDPQAVMSTLATPIRSRKQFEDPACVKVVFDFAAAGDVLQPQPDTVSPRVGRRPAGGRSAAFLSARRTVCLPPRLSAETCANAARASWRKSRSWSNCGFCRPDSRSWWAWFTRTPAESTPRTTTGRLWHAVRNR